MADQIQFRGGTAAESASFTGAAREVTVDTTNNTLRVHDGTTAGGHLLAKASDLTTTQTAQTNALAALGVASGDTSLGTFSGSALADNLTVKAALQAIETLIETKQSLLGTTQADLGAFTGSTIADGSTIKGALQTLETQLEAIDLDTDDLAALAGIAENTTNLGTFTGSLISDNVSVKAALQALETATELRATIASPAFTGNLATLIGSGDHPVVQRIQGGFPDINLRTNGSNVTLNQNEGRLLWEDAGGGGVAAIKQVMLPTAPMRFFVGGINAADERMRINANGRVGIGNTNPQAQLHVQGSALVQADFPDFQMRSGGEKRLIFEDNGGGALAAIKCAGQHMKMFAGGVTAGDQIAEVNASGLTFSSGKALNLDSVAVTGVQTSGESFSDDDVSLMTSAAIADYVTANSGVSGLTATAAELNILDGATLTTAELNYVDGVTSAIQTQLDGKYATSGGELTGSVTISASFPDLTLKSNGERRLLFSDAGGSANAGLKYASSALQFVYGGVASGDIEMKIEDAKVTITNELALPATVSAAAATDITIVDNTADAFEIKEGSNQYVAISTTDSNEKIEVFKNLHLAGDRLFFEGGSQLIRLQDNQTSALKIENHDGSTQDFLDFKTANSGPELIFGAPNQFNNTITVGVDDTGYDVTFYGATASAYMQWDESADALVLAGSATLDVAGDIDVDGTANLDVLDVDGTANFASTVEVNDTLTMKANINFTGSGREIRFKDNTYNALRFQKEDGTTYMGFDTQGDATIFFSQPLDVNTTMQIDGTVTVGVDDTGYDVKFFGATASAYMLWDESADDLILAGSAGLVVPDGQLTLGSTPVTSTAAELNILDGVTSTAAELNLLDGTTAGTAVASKALAVDANLDLTGVRNFTITGDLSVAGNMVTVDTVTMTAQNAIVFEGATADDFESTLTIIDPTADRTIKLPNQSGCLPVLAADSATAITATPEELNILDGVTSTAAELNILDGVTSTAAELNILDGVTATAAELNLLDGVTATTTELNYVDGVTSAIQTQINAQAALTTVHGGLLGATAGTVSGQTAVIVDVNKDITGFRNLTVTGDLTVPEGDLTIGSTAVTSTAAELNILDGVTATTAELNILDGVTSTAAELNILDGVTSTAAELNILDGVTSTTAELNILDGVTATATELNLLDGVTATTAELNYVDGVTSNIQTQLDAKLASSGAKAALDVDHLITLSGVSAAADNLGTFSGSTISDNQTVKAAIQALETAVEGKQATDAELTELATMASNTAAALADLTEAEVQILDGATVTTAELNILDGVTSTAAELNILDGVTATAAELNILDGVTASAADINLIDGITNGTVIASKAIITDSNKDISGGRNITITGELDAATLDISGDADIDGTTNLDAVDIDGAVDMASTLIMSGGLTDAADDTAAASAGVAVNQLYRTGSVVKIRVS